MDDAGAVCLTCNRSRGQRCRLRLHGRDGDTDLEAVLCGRCRAAHLDQDWIERLDDPGG